MFIYLSPSFARFVFHTLILLLLLLLMHADDWWEGKTVYIQRLKYISLNLSRVFICRKDPSPPDRTFQFIASTALSLFL
jgi:hypothetical protein